MRFAALLLLAACATAPAVRPEADALLRLYETKNALAAAELFAPKAYFLTAAGRAVSGRENIRRFLESSLGAGDWEQSVHREMFDADGDVAVERGRYQITFSPNASTPAGVGSFSETGHYVIHWRRENGVWRIATYIATARR